MVRRALAACFCLLLTAFPALAAGENATFFLREDEKSPVALSLCAHEGALYIVCEEGIYAYRPGDEAPERVADYVFGCWIAGDDGMYAPDERIRPTPDLLYSQGGKLYGVNTSYAQFGEVEMGAAWALRDPVALDCLDYAPDGSLYLEKSWLEGDRLYASVYGVAGDGLSLLAIDAKSGETAPLPGSEHREAAPYKPGSALLLCEGDSAPRLLAYDLRSGEAKEIHAFGCAEDEPNGLAYDASSDTIYCAQGGARR